MKRLLAGLALVTGGVVAVNLASSSGAAPEPAYSNCEQASESYVICMTVTTTEVPPSTTIQPTSTSGATTSSATSVATSVPPTTAQPTTSTTSSTVVPPTTSPSGLFVENFSTAAGFYDRFNYGLSGVHPASFPEVDPVWEGDHSMGCEGASTSRDIHLGASAADIGESFYHCAPGGPDTGHLMTSWLTPGYSYLWFSPDQYFTNVRRICWDQNLTFEGGRKWTEMIVAGRADVERVRAELGHLDLGFVGPNNRDPAGPTTGVIPTDQTWGFGTIVGIMSIWNGDHHVAHVGGVDKSNEDVATRRRHCVVDNEDGTITVTFDRAAYGPITETVPGDLPDDDVMVAWQDNNYNPTKDADYDPGQNTWHWDNILIETEN